MQVDLLNKIEEASGRLEKEAILKNADKSTVKFLCWTLDPIITFGVTIDPESVQMSDTRHATESDYWITFDYVLQSLSKREITGHAAISRMYSVIEMAPTDDCVKWSCRIINKDLRAGLQLSTLLKVFPGAVEPFACSLAKPYDPEKHEIRGPWSVEPKLDGLRMIVKDGQAFTRNGRTIDTVGHIIEELSKLGPDYVFDGEIMGSTDFNQDSGKIRKKDGGPNTDLVYNIFDCVWRDQWEKKETISYRERREFLFEAMGTLEPKHSREVPITYLIDPTTEQLFAARDKYIEMGYEGAMLKDLKAPYYFKRSDSLLKLKTFKDADGRIATAFEGKGRHKGRLGGFIIDFDGVLTRVGSGFSDEQRDLFWKNQKNMIGKMVEVQYQEKTPDGLLRFPVFIKMRPDRD